MQTTLDFNFFVTGNPATLRHTPYYTNGIHFLRCATRRIFTRNFHPITFLQQTFGDICLVFFILLIIHTGRTSITSQSLWGVDQRFCDDRTKALVIQRVTMGGRGQKFKNCFIYGRLHIKNVILKTIILQRCLLRFGKDYTCVTSKPILTL